MLIWRHTNVANCIHSFRENPEMKFQRNMDSLDTWSKLLPRLMRLSGSKRSVRTLLRRNQLPMTMPIPKTHQFLSNIRSVLFTFGRYQFGNLIFIFLSIGWLNMHLVPRLILMRNLWSLAMELKLEALQKFLHIFLMQENGPFYGLQWWRQGGIISFKRDVMLVQKWQGWRLSLLYNGEERFSAKGLTQYWCYWGWESPWP